MPLNRARRACVATRNSSREAALAWCVDHASDPGIDLPYLPPRRPAVGIGSQRTNGVGGSIDSSSGGDSGEEGSAAWGANGRTAARARRMAADGLEAYVRARLTVLRRGEGGGGVREGSNGFETMKSERSAEARELTAVLTSFRKRQSVGEAEERASALLPAGVDLERFARDVGYRQVGWGIFWMNGVAAHGGGCEAGWRGFLLFHLGATPVFNVRGELRVLDIKWREGEARLLQEKGYAGANV